MLFRSDVVVAVGVPTKARAIPTRVAPSESAGVAPVVPLAFAWAAAKPVGGTSIEAPVTTAITPEPLNELALKVHVTTEPASLAVADFQKSACVSVPLVWSTPRRVQPAGVWTVVPLTVIAATRASPVVTLAGTVIVKLALPEFELVVPVANEAIDPFDVKNLTSADSGIA